jgi:prolipoprotein diacylglyceryl transferase
MSPRERPLLLASIPSPSTNSINIGPLELRAYGIMIAFGVIAAVWLAQKRYASRGHDPEVIATLAMWTVPAGVIGARIYHVITDNQRFRGNWGEAFKIWEGGLGIWGGVAGGVLMAIWLAKRRSWDLRDLLDSVAPAIPLGQAIGRFGNWFNQELFGGPTDLPWGLEIDEAHRPTQYLGESTFHPTFLYESLWNVLVVVAIVWLVPRMIPNLKRGLQFGVYVVLYTVGRLWIELVRIDNATELFGVRVNVFTSVIVGLCAAVVVVVLQRRLPAEDEVGPDDEDVAADVGAPSSR